MTELNTAAAAETVIDDRFEHPLAPGTVRDSTASSGHPRLVADREGAIAIDHGQLRIGWMEHEGWGRAALAYGPLAEPVGLVLVVTALNGLMTAQSDPRPEGRRAALRRLRATFPHLSLSQPRLRDNLLIGWFSEPTTHHAPTPVAAVVHRAGDDATGELWFQVGDQRIRLARDVQNLPARYVVAIESGSAALYAWSYPGSHGFGARGDVTPLARVAFSGPLPSLVFAALHQPVLGEVRYRVDTRVQSVRVLRCPGGLNDDTVASLSQPDWWEPAMGPVVGEDRFGGQPGDLAVAVEGSLSWKRVLGEGVIERTGTGQARVRGTIADPNPGRTVYCVPWDGGGVEVSTTVIPPGTARGEGEQGRSGLAIWQDADNHLILNHFIDDGSVGVSISAFLRTGGREEMFIWDAVWSNVSTRVQWGQPFRLSVACDGHQFLCRIGDEPVLYRQLTDYRPDAEPLRITGIGLAANWEWGDDTGTAFEDFAVRPLIERPAVEPAEPPGR